MATVQIELPDQLIERAESAGLLSPDKLESWLRQQLRTYAFEQLRIARERMDALDDLPYMSPEEVAEEIALMRAEKRAAAGS